MSDERDLVYVKSRRYDKLRDWFLSPHSDENFFENMPDGKEPVTPERFDAAVDALPDHPEEMCDYGGNHRLSDCNCDPHDLGG